ncbi:MAG: alpha/beta hydrolase [Defluviitaleaceae bacterium]|nr:alpha/beta hydrolase [Defluviitaleaceae bacterium]
MEFIINDLPIYYEEHGQGKPVLCLHGFSYDMESIKGCMEPFFAGKPGYKRIYLDMPGMGKTPGADWIKNADIMLDIFKQFIKSVIGEEGFLLAGNSYGGYMSLGLAADEELDIEGIFLFAPVTVTDFDSRTLPECEDEDLFVEDGLEDSIPEADEDIFDDFINSAVIATTHIWQRYKKEIAPGYGSYDKEFTKKYREGGYALSFESKFKELSFDKPVTLMVGRQDEGCGYEDQWNTLKGLPRLTFVALDRAGHLLQMEHPNTFNFHLADWLEKVK